ncbi:c-type cytochrome [Sulfurimonas sp.]|nr:c-type cytochrome [Sulfurimonas sp.]
MQKIILLFIFAPLLFAIDGEDVYKKNCKSCHIDMISKAEFRSQLKERQAPPMIAVATKLKNTIIIQDRENSEEIHRFTVISFIKEYLKYPSAEYYACSGSAVNRFDIMPAQDHLSEEELQAVSEWIYDNYEDEDYN